MLFGLILSTALLCPAAWLQDNAPPPQSPQESSSATPKSSPPNAAAPAPGMAEYRDGNFETALPLLRTAAAAKPDDAELQAALLATLTYLGRVDEASDANEVDKQKFPDSLPVMAARAEFAFYMGDMSQTEHLVRAALKLDANNARVLYTYSRLAHAASMYHTARLLALQAHQTGPDDALITRYWLGFVSPEMRRQLFPAFIAAHPWFYKYMDMARQSNSAIRSELDGRKAFELDGSPQEITLHFTLVMSPDRRAHGVALWVKVEERRLFLLFDTGASGILVTQRAVDKAGLSHLGSTKSYGIGDEGERETFAAVSDTCEIGDLKFKTCVMHALSGKHSIAPDIDGLIGADFFSAYLMDIDFQKLTLHLTPLPPREANPQGYDREIAADEKDFTPVFRFGHQLMLSTTLNQKATGLFLLDTGSSVSNVDTTFASLSTKLEKNDWIHMHGISGDVKQVFEADKAELQFAHYRQDNLGLIAFNLNNREEHQEVRMSGILGIPVLSMFRMRLDYRNGLVKFDYILGEKKKH